MNNLEHTEPDYSGSGPVEYPPGVNPPVAREWLPAGEEARLLAIPGVTSVGLGVGPAGDHAVVIGVTDAGVARQLPSEVGGTPVVVEVTGEVTARDPLRARRSPS